MFVLREPKAFCLEFYWPKNIDKSKKSLAENKIKSNTEQLLLKY